MNTKFVYILLVIFAFSFLGIASVAWGEIDAELLRKAKAGDADAQLSLAQKYDYGEGVAEDDAEAVKWYRKAAEQGNAKAQFHLATLYSLGAGVAEDDAEAVKWYRKAAEQGNAKARFGLGGMYAKGEGVAQNYVVTHMWWYLARAQGYYPAREGMKLLLKQMTREQIAEAQKNAWEWEEKHRSQ